MKALLRKTLTETQYHSLSVLKNRFLPYTAFQLGHAPFLIISALIRILPSRSRVAIKSDINVVRRLDYGPRQIKMNVDSDFEYQVRLNSCRKEPETVNWIETFFKDGQVWYDIGANTGAYTLVASTFFEGRVRVYAFEPAFQNYTQLCKNLALNHCDDSVVPLQVALSDHTGIETFNYRNLVTGSAVHALGEPVNQRGETFTPVLAQPALSYRADDFISQFNLPLPNHIKIDVDGIEFPIIMGFEKTLDDPALKSIFLELNEERGDGPQLLGFLKDKGFKVHSRHRANHIFIRET